MGKLGDAFETNKTITLNCQVTAVNLLHYLLHNRFFLEDSECLENCMYAFYIKLCRKIGSATINLIAALEDLQTQSQGTGMLKLGIPRFSFNAKNLSRDHHTST